jgi:hypothetical protein
MKVRWRVPWFVFCPQLKMVSTCSFCLLLAAC